MRQSVKENLIETVKLLVVSRDSSVLGHLWPAGESNSWQIEIAADAWDALDKVRSGIALDLLLLDLPKEHGDGLQVLRTLRRLRPALSVVLVGHAEDPVRNQEAIRMGAREYLIKPLSDNELEMAIKRNLSAIEEAEIDVTGDDVEPLGNGASFIGLSPMMRKLRTQAALIAEIDLPVFIYGEPGSGKETIARLLHRLSVRSGFPFARVNCAALPEELLEREIFGDLAGEAPNPSRATCGKLELCDKGTIFLEEIAEMPLRLQSRLVQVLQNGQLVRSGTSECVSVDVRVMAASSKPLDQAVSEHKLLAELSRQLGVYELLVPALRHRKEELPVLSRHFMHRLAKHYGLPSRDFTPAVNEAWMEHEWPGNLRELEQSVKRYLVVGDKGLGLQRMARHACDAAKDAASLKQDPLTVRKSLRQSETGICGYKSLRALLQSIKSEAEKNAITFALEKTGWNRKAAARLLKTSYRTVLYKIEQYKLSAPNSAPFPSVNGSEHSGREFPANGRADAKVANLQDLQASRPFDWKAGSSLTVRN
jgi:two-component system response regulator AtoC